MSDIHVTRDMLRAAAAGALDPALLEGIRRHHLHTLCPFCREEYAAFQAEKAGNANNLAIVQHLPAILEAQLPRIQAGQRNAKRDLKALLKLPLMQRRRKIRAAWTRFREPALAALLLEEAVRQTPADPRLSFHFAKLASEVLRRAPDHRGDKSALEVRVFAHMANARRAVGDLARADRLLLRARYTLRMQGVTDLATCAQLDWYEGALAKDQRRFEEATNFLLRSAMLYSLLGASAEAAKPLLTLSLSMSTAGETVKAIQLARQAAQSLHPSAQPRLYAQARYNLALFQCEAGDYKEAAALLKKDAELHAQFQDTWTQSRLTWLRGKIATGTGDHQVAEASLLAAKASLSTTGNGYVVAMVSLDLAALYLLQGRAAELQQLAAEMVTLFEARGVHREALAAALLFEQATRRETLTRGLLRELAGRVERACDESRGARRNRRAKRQQLEAAPSLEASLP